MKTRILVILLIVLIVPLLFSCNGEKASVVSPSSSAPPPTSSAPPQASSVPSQTSSTTPQTSSIPPQTSTTNVTYPTFEGIYVKPDKGQVINTILADGYGPVPNITVVTVGTKVTWISRNWAGLDIETEASIFAAYLNPGEQFAYTFDNPGVCVFEFLPSAAIGEVIVLDLRDTSSIYWQMLTDSTLWYYQ
jgi:hypothetical protein